MNMSHKNCGHEATKSARARCRKANGKVIPAVPPARSPQRENKKVDRDYLFTRRIKKAGPNECWVWDGRTDKHGYGYLTVRDGYKTKSVKATRWVMEKHLGRKLNPEEWVLHSCDNPPCCNPNHLRLGTAKDNARDRVNRGRHNHAGKTHCKWGHEFTPENTGVQSSGSGRTCLTCVKLRNQYRRDKNFSGDFSEYVALHASDDSGYR